MRSHLSRSVFRRVLANEPIVHRGCLRRSSYLTSSNCAPSTRRPTAHNGWRDAQRQQTRTLFNFNLFGDTRTSTRADMEPGIEEMMALSRRQKMRARLPPAKDVAYAFKRLIAAKKQHNRPLSDFEAQLALQSFRHIMQEVKEIDSRDGAATPLLEAESIDHASHVLRYSTTIMAQAHVELAEALYTASVSSQFVKARDACLHAYVACLCSLRLTGKAKGVLLSSAGAPDSSPCHELSSVEQDQDGDTSREEGRRMDKEIAAVWETLLAGFAREGNETELLQTYAMTRSFTHSEQEEQQFTRCMLRFYTKVNNPAAIKHWWTLYYKQIILRRGSSTFRRSQRDDLNDVLLWCMRSKEFQFGHEVVRDLASNNPLKHEWDAIFLWAACTGKGPEEIDRMIGVMEQTNEQRKRPKEWRLADSATINTLVHYATSQKDPYMAERFVSLGRNRGIQPDARTLVLQIEYRLGVGDVDGALIAYKNMQDLDRSDNEDVSAVNRLIVALCQGRRHDFDTIMNVAADLSDRRTRFEPRTVETLALLHLSRGEQDDVLDLLNTHTFHFSTIERNSILDAIIGFIKDPERSTGRAWEAYTILRTVFDETSRDKRSEIMTAFFNRGRPDMASNVFLNMRQHNNEAILPTAETYVSAFLGIAKVQDTESLDVIHNQLKLDFTVTPTTMLYNSLIIAYTACGRPRSALAFWGEIVASREGPSYNSLHIVMRACERAAFGDAVAQSIWSTIRRRRVKLDNALWTSYVAALAGNGNNDLALGTLEEAFEKSEVEVDTFVLASLYMAAPGPTKRNEIVIWARDKFPGLWADVEKMGFEDDDQGTRRVVGIDRSVTP